MSVVNLNRRRKAKAAAQAKAKAVENRVRFGRTKVEKAFDARLGLRTPLAPRGSADPERDQASTGERKPWPFEDKMR